MVIDMLAFSPGREGVAAVTVPGSGSAAVQHIRQTPFLSHQGGHPDQSVLQLYGDHYGDPYNDPYGDPSYGDPSYGDPYDDPNDWMLYACCILMNVILQILLPCL